MVWKSLSISLYVLISLLSNFEYRYVPAHMMKDSIIQVHVIIAMFIALPETKSLPRYEVVMLLVKETDNAMSVSFINCLAISLGFFELISSSSCDFFGSG